MTRNMGTKKSKIMLFCSKVDLLIGAKKELYYALYDAFSKILIDHNPCKFIEDTCFWNRDTNTNNGCCRVCAKNTRRGCSIQSLGCRAFLCDKAFYNLPQEVQEEWRELTAIKDKYFEEKLRDDYNINPK